MAPISATPNVSAIIIEVGKMPVSKMQALLEDLNKGSLKVTQAAADKIKAAIGTRANVLINMNPTLQEQNILKLMMYDGESAKMLEVNGSFNNRAYIQSCDPRGRGIGVRLDIPPGYDFNPHSYDENYANNSG